MFGNCNNEILFAEEEDEFQVLQKTRKFNANLIKIKFEYLKQKQELALGDPRFCKNCKAALNWNSHLKKVKENVQEWTCEFCGSQSVIDIEDQELPQRDDVQYMLQSVQQVIGSDKPNVKEGENEISIIFCLDLSGSMSVTCELASEIDLKRGAVTNSELENLRQFMEPWEYQQILKESNNQYKKYVSRKNCVLAAIETQIDEMRHNFPHRKIGLVTFNDEVQIIGDGKNLPIVIAGDKLNHYEVCLQEGQKAFASHLSLPVSLSGPALLASLDKLSESGKTALGPGLATALGLASQAKKGSMIIICTDGLSNVGFGALDVPSELEATSKMFDQMGQFAADHGIVVSTVTMKGEECNVLMLSKLKEATHGSILRVNPETLATDFAKALKQEVLATNVEIRIQLHQGLYFQQELELQQLNKNRIIQENVCTEKVGNVTQHTKIIFKYEIKSPKQLEQMGINITNNTQLPLQAQVFYTSTEGNKMIRIITQYKKISKDLKKYENELKFDIFNDHYQAENANYALMGNVQEAQKRNMEIQSYMANELVAAKQDSSEKEQILENNNQLVLFNNVLEKKAKKQQKKFPPKKAMLDDKPKEEKKKQDDSEDSGNEDDLDQQLIDMI